MFIKFLWNELNILFQKAIRVLAEGYLNLSNAELCIKYLVWLENLAGSFRAWPWRWLPNLKATLKHVLMALRSSEIIRLELFQLMITGPKGDNGGWKWAMKKWWTKLTIYRAVCCWCIWMNIKVQCKVIHMNFCNDITQTPLMTSQKLLSDRFEWVPFHQKIFTFNWSPVESKLYCHSVQCHQGAESI